MLSLVTQSTEPAQAILDVNDRPTATSKYWEETVKSVEPCMLKLPHSFEESTSTWKSVVLPVPFSEIQSFWTNNKNLQPPAVILTAWSLLLQNYVGSANVCFGYQTDDRGVFGRTLVSLYQHREDDSIQAILNRIQSAFAESKSSQNFIPGNIETELFNTIVLLGGKASEQIPRRKDDSEGFPAGVQIEGYDLILDASNHDLCKVSLWYRTSKLVDSQALGIIHTFSTICTVLMRDVRLSLRDVSLLGDLDHKQIWKWNSKRTEPLELCVHEILERQARLTPDRIAITSWDGEFSYREFDEFSTRLGHYLVDECHFGIETMVAFAFEKSRWAAVAMTAVMKSGGICVPLNPNDPTTRQEEILKDIGAEIIICSPGLRNIVSRESRRFVVVDETFCHQLPFDSSIPCSDVQPKNGAFLVFTSGSTGKPKGIVQEHRAMSTSVRDHGAAMLMNSQHAKTYQFSAYTFDTSVSDMFGTFLGGGCVCLPSDHDRMNDLANSINNLGANVTCLTPAVVDQLWPGEVPNLKVLSVGGEALTRRIVERWSEKVHLINVYGVTECLVWCITTGFIKREDSPANMGRAVCGRAWISSVVDYNKLAPIGGVGELLIEGPNLARHYYNNPAKTQESFVDTPKFLQCDGLEPSPRVYRTGDLVQYSSDGTINYIGRRDSQVKLGGNRVDFGEIEHHIKGLTPAKTDVVCDVMSSSGKEKSLVVCLSLRQDLDDQTPEWQSRFENLTKKLKYALAKLLPAYMVPHHYFHLQQMPLTSSGKMDRKKVIRMALESGATSPASAVETPVQTTTEEELRKLWTAIFEVSLTDIHAGSSFLHFGDSIAAMKLVSAARKKGYSLTVADILQYPVLVDMAGQMKRRDNYSPVLGDTVQPFSLLDTAADQVEVKANAAAQCRCPIEAITDIFPCTPLQEGLMASSIRQPGSYIAQDVLNLAPGIKLDRFKAAWETVVKHNAILRTRLLQEKSGMVQAIIADSIEWRTGDDLELYLENDREVPMALGDRLTRFGLITRGSTSIMVLTRHHSTYDGFITPLIYGQVQDAYFGNTLRPTADLKPFIKYLTGSDKQSAELFWRSELEDATATNFPPASTSLVHPMTREKYWSEIEFTKPISSDFTMSTVFRAAWALLVATYCGVNDVTIGTTLAGRTASVSNMDSIIGPTITTVPIRVRLDRKMTINAFLKQLQDQSIAMMPHEHFGLQNIRRLGEAAESACNFQSLLVVQPEMPSKDSSIFSSGTEPEALEETRTNALTLQVWQKHVGAKLVASYDPQAFEGKQLQRLIHQYGHVVQQLCASWQQSLVQGISVLTSSDQEEISGWNLDEPREAYNCIHHIFEKNAASHLNAPAISAWDGKLSYHQLDLLSSRLAHHLVGLGVGPEVKVPFCFEKSVWAIVALVAILKAGGAYVALDPSHPMGRLRAIVEDVGAFVILSSASNGKSCSKLVDTVCIVSRLAIENLPDIPGTPQTLVTPRNAAYVQFTSGTTGKPKGVVIEHRSYCTAFMGHRDPTRINHRSRVLQFASYSFDVANQDILTTLMTGACLCTPSEDERQGNITKAINKYNVNNANLTPSVSKLILPSEVPSLEVLQLAGEAMTVDDIQRWGSVLHLLNGYGPSECCCVSSVNRSPKIEGNDARNIGHAVGCRLWIVDSDNHQRLAPVGGVGELIIEGPIVGRGYLNDSEKTAAAFVPHPDWLTGQSSHDSKVYKTGDLVRYSSDGSISYVGRKDNQVKLRGQRMELGEIEFQLSRAMPAASDIVVDVTTPLNSKKQMLVAFVRLFHQGQKAKSADDATLLAENLVKAMDGVDAKLAQVLPSYMIPSAFVSVTEIPLTLSQKVDRNKLRALASKLTLKQFVGFSQSCTTHQTILTGMEKRLREAWARVLKIDADTISSYDNFIRLGGDSIDAIRLVSTVRTDGLSLAVADVFKYPRLSDLSLTMREDTKEDKATDYKPFGLLGTAERTKAIVDTASSICGISAAHIEDIYPCSPLQQGMMAVSMISPGKVVSTKTFTLSLDVDLTRFKAAWQTVMKQNPILRTRVVQVESELLQVVTTVPASWGNVDDLDVHCQEERRTMIKLGEPLVRFAIGQGSDSTNYRFCLTLHHFVYDGWSLELILGQLESVYRGNPISLPPSFPAFITYLHANDRFNQSATFWKSHLAGASPDIFPMPNSAEKVVRPDITISTHFSLSKSSQTNVTTSTILRGAWAMIAAAYTGNDDVVYGATVSGRSAPLQNIDKIVGPTIATVPVRVNVEQSQSISRFLSNLQQQSVDMIPFEQMGLQNIRMLSPDAELACSFQTILIIQPVAPQKETPGVLDSSQSADNMADFNTYGLMIECQLLESGIMLNANFCSSLLDEWQMKRMLAQFAHVVTQLSVKDPSHPVGTIEMVSEEEKAQLGAWEPMDVEAVQSCVHNLISRWPEATPGSQAIDSWDGSMTYAELDTTSTTLAHYLVDLGVGPDVLVPLCFEKSLWTIVSMLAVLKAGGAFVPLDASHPVARLESIVRQTQAKLILCSDENATIIRGTATASAILVVTASSLSLMDVPCGKLPNVLPHNSAYCLFTSGTTGKPKGVIIEHAAFSTSAKAQGQFFGLSSSSRVLQFASYSFDINLFEILSTLIAGGCVCVPSDNERRDPQAISTAISRMGVNTAGLTPSYIDVISPSKIPTLKTLILGGEALKKVHVDTWAACVKLMSAYGPTECSVSCSINNDMQIGSDPRNVGRGAGAIRWIVDPKNSDRLRPIGAVGELIIEGPLLARGYLNNAEKELEAFIQGPAFLGSGRRRRYKTGDLVRYNHDGTMTYVSRKDNQVKVRGQRLEVEEVERHIASHSPSIGCVVLVPKSGPWEKQLVAMLSMCGPPTSNSENLAGDGILEVTRAPTEVVRKLLTDLEDYLFTNLPQSIIPTMWIVVEGIPFTKAMKLDRAAVERYVATMDTEAQQAARDLIQPCCESHDWSDLESSMRDAWSEVLKVSTESVSIKSNFFRLGGDSIAAMRLVDLIRSNGVSLSVADIFNNPQLSSMCNVAPINLANSSISEMRPFSTLSNLDLSTILLEASRVCGVERDMVEDIYPCTPLQEGLMVLSNGRPGAYIMQHVEHIPKDKNIARFCAAWENVAKSHQILRTRIMQSSLGLTLQVVDKRGLTWAHTDNLYEYLKQDLALPTSFGDPLTRLAIINESTSDNSYFVMTVHHSSFDGQSLPRILHKVRVTYEGEPDEVSMPFKYFINYLSNLNTAASEEYWRSKLEGCVSQNWPSLPSVSHQPLDDTTIFLDISFRRPSNCRFTSSTMMRSAWAILLAKYTGTNDVVFGATLTGRNVPVSGIAHMVGPTITTVPLRIMLGEESVEELLQRIQDEFVAMIPFEQTGLQNIRHISSSAAVACEFQSLLSIIPAPDEKLGTSIFNSTETPTIKESNASLTYAITLFCELGVSTTRLKASFDSRCVTHKQTERILHQMDHILQQLCAEGSLAGTLVRDIETISPLDKVQLGHLNRAVPPKSDDLILDRIQYTARNYPNSTAVHAWDGLFSYEELDNISSRLALQLIHDGIGPGNIIPLCFEKSKWNIVAMLGVLKSGAAFNPLDPTQPKDRLRKLTQTTGATTILCSSANLQLCRDITPNVKEVSSTSISTLILPESMKLPEIEFTTDMYVLFTSGSTGTPKGVVIQHGPMSTSAEAHGPVLGITRSSRVLQFSGHTWDVSILDIITSLSHGACVCIPSDFDRMNNLPKFVNEARVNFMSLTPSVVQTLNPSELPGVKSLAVLGESWGQGIMDIWARKVKIFNVYGPTEASVLCTVTEVDPDNYRKNNLGFAVGASLWVTDPNNHNALLPIGAVGELLVEGSILGKGYLNDPVKTKSSFVGRPIWATENLVPGRSPPQRLYRSGDLVRYDDDLTLRFEGRKDAQVKVRGQRLELEEVEHNITADSRIQSCLVSYPKTGILKGQLVGVVCLSQSALESKATQERVQDSASLMPSSNPSASSICQGVRSDLAARIADYMIPTVWLTVEEMPLLISTKIARNLLNAWILPITPDDVARFSAISKGEANEICVPKTEAESTIQSVLSEVLNLPREEISTTASFTSLGGDSVLAMLVVSRCRAKNIIISVRDMLQYRTIAALATVVQHTALNVNGKQAKDAVACVHENRWISKLTTEILSGLGIPSAAMVEDVLPCLPTQQEMLASRLEHKDFYRVQGIFKLDSSLGLIDIDRLEQVWTRLVARHGALRSRFTDQLSTNGDMCQIVLNSPSFLFSKYTTDSSDNALKKLNSLSLSSITNPFCVTVCVTGDGQTYCRLEAHHAVIDHASFGILLRELQLAYVNELPDNGTPGPSYGSFVNYYKLEKSETSTEYWKNYLEGCQSIPFPVQSNEPAQLLQSTPIHINNIQYLRSFCEANHLTLFNLVQTAWALLLRQYTQSEDVGFCYLLSQRDALIERVSEIVGLILNILPLRHQFKPGDTNMDLARQVRDEFSNSLSHSYSSFERPTQGSESGTRLRFDTLINYRGRISDAEQETEGPLTFEMVDGKDPMHYTLVLAIEDSDKGPSFLLSYWEPRITSEFARNIVADFNNILTRITSST